MKQSDGSWGITMQSGYERPAKPKNGLAGDTINCPALLQIEAGDSASPLHRLVYATINEAYDRGFFSDNSLERNMDRVEFEREALRKIDYVGEDDKNKMSDLELQKLVDLYLTSAGYTAPKPPANP